MSDTTDRTHDSGLKSWVDSANLPGTDFPVQNLPFGVFRRSGDQRTVILIKGRSGSPC